MSKNKKHSLETRREVVRACLGGISIWEASRRWQVARSLVKKWVDHYEQAGMDGLSGQYGRVYSLSLKEEVVRTYRTGGLSLRECCLKYGIASQSTLSNWIRRHEKSGIDGLKPGRRGRPRSMKRQPKKESGPLTRLEELEKEVLYLRAENELLKKLDALIREREAVPQKKRKPSRD